MLSPGAFNTMPPIVPNQNRQDYTGVPPPGTPGGEKTLKPQSDVPPS